MVDTLYVVVAAYLSLCFAKFCLMVSTAHVAAGTHLRMTARQGFRINPIKCYLALVGSIIFIVLLSTPYALYKERWRFFRAYTRRETMRDIVAEYRT